LIFKNDESTVLFPPEGGRDPEPDPVVPLVTLSTGIVVLEQSLRRMSLNAYQSQLRPELVLIAAYSRLRVLFFKFFKMTGPIPLSSNE
jgi:hypothetical protein